MSNLRDKAVNGVFWSVIERFGNQGVQFLIGLILARLLMPKDYGLLGMLLVFISFAQVLVEGGFSSALIRKSLPTLSDYSTVFWFNLIASLIFYAIIFLFAPLISQFFNEPLLIPLAKITGLNIIISAFGIIQKTILTKELDFKSQAKINIGSIIISGLIGVLAAWQGYGVWALVIQNLVRNILMNIGFWIQSKWRPIPIFSKNSFKELFGFGSKLMFSSLINAISDNLFAIIIGKLYSANSLGFYTRANQFQKLPVSSIYGAISAVSYPVLSEIQNDNEKLKEGYRSMIKLTAFVLFPIMVILGSVSQPMIHIILTDKWLPSVPILQILCIIGAFYPLHAINLDILKVKGRSDLFLKLEIFKQVLNIIMIIICYKFGVIGLVWGAVVLNFVCYYFNSFFSKMLLNYSFINQLKDLMAIAFISFLTLFFLFIVNQFIINEYLQLFISVICGTIFYLLIAYLLNVKEYYTFKNILFSLFAKKKPFLA